MPNTSAETVQEWQCTVQNLTLHGRLWHADADGVPVLALHGWLDNAASFDKLAPLLSSHPLLALDSPGQGLSDHRPDSGFYNIWEDLPILLAVADSMGWQRFALLGHSRGAAQTCLLAAAVPERISHLVCLDGLIYGGMEDGDIAAQLGKFIRRYSDFSSSQVPPRYETIDEAIAARQKHTGFSEASSRMLVERGIESRDGRYGWRSDRRLSWPSSVKLNKAQEKAVLESVECPTLLVAADDGHAEWIRLNRNLEELQNWQIETLSGGHHQHMEAEAPAVAAYINDFFDKHSA